MTKAAFRKRFAANVATLRVVCGLSQAELGKKIGISQFWVSHIECGRRLPDAYLLWRITQVFGYQVLP